MSRAYQQAMEPALATIPAIAGGLFLIAGALGSVYMFVAAIIFGRFFKDLEPPTRRSDAVTMLKPLYGDEPHLERNLASFLAQDHAGPIELVCGVARHDDPAIDVVRSLQIVRTGDAVTLVIDAARHGASGKVSNLANMSGYASHDVIILSDSDMVVSPDYLAHTLTALDPPGVGAVTLLYRGYGGAGFWSRLGAAGLSYQFLPGAVFGVALKLATPCMGSTIALARSTLDRIGGFARFADVLADDYAIGEAIRGLGLEVAVPPLLVTHASAEGSFAELWRHELRWGVTVRDVVPGAYAGSVISMPLPLALIGAVLCPAHQIGLILSLVALASRLVMIRVVDRQVGTSTATPWLLPLRDSLTLTVFIATFFVRAVDWRGNRLTIHRNGRIAADTESLA